MNLSFSYLIFHYYDFKLLAALFCTEEWLILHEHFFFYSINRQLKNKPCQMRRTWYIGQASLKHFRDSFFLGLFLGSLIQLNSRAFDKCYTCSSHTHSVKVDYYHGHTRGSRDAKTYASYLDLYMCKSNYNHRCKVHFKLFFSTCNFIPLRYICQKEASVGSEIFQNREQENKSLSKASDSVILQQFPQSRSTTWCLCRLFLKR